MRELEPKDTLLYVRINAAQKRRWARAARKAGLQLSVYVRQIVNAKADADLADHR